MSPRNEIKDLLNFSRSVVQKAGQILFNQQKVKIIKYKDAQDIATNADLESEKFIIDSILKKYPSHAIFSEEKGEINKKSDFRWVIDPLDGTKEFIRKIPLFNVSVALEFKYEVIVSCVYRPSENTLYSAAKGFGGFRNSSKISVSKVKSLDKAFVYCYLPSFHRQQDKYDWAWKVLGEIGKRVYRLRSLSDENTALCWLAQGGIEAYLNLSNPPKWHDVAPGLFIAKQAGALISDAEENEINSPKVESLVVANRKWVQESLIEIIKSTNFPKSNPKSNSEME